HILGPESDEIKLKIIYLDSLIGIFINKLDKIDIANKINIIVTSDHGMGTISKNKVIYPEDYIKQEWLDKYTGNNPFFMFQPKEGYLDSVFFALKKAEHLQVWRKSQIPEQLHYGTNPRIMEIVAVADSGWSIEYRAIVEQDKNFNGTHGYDPANKDMHTIFFACGPAFKKGYVHPAFENIHIYPLIAHILNLNPAPVDGNFDAIRKMLKGN
ncbi:MAG: alkaline phosphatase family protein, partial [Candidatus Neomarinimicrobiota bacterium]